MVTGVHRALLRATHGRVLGHLGGMPVVVLVTTGRRTGRRRATVLTSPVQLGDRLVLVASYGGDDRHPDWFLNLRADPDVEVVAGGWHRRMRARVATSEERQRLWPEVVGRYRGYERYQERTAREIPLVILEPAARLTGGG